MKFYFAPLEGVVGYIYRNAYNAHFNHGRIHKFFSPFIAADQHKKFPTKVQNDVCQENNSGLVLIPQILTNNAEDFIFTAKKLHRMGYTELNLNLGCPSGTVVSKKRGSGFLAYPEALDAFLEKIFDQPFVDISIKTRLGKDQHDEFYHLMKIYNKYPLKELIIHPRIQKDYYKNKPHMEIFKDALASSVNPVCYNGDIFTPEDYLEFTAAFPQVDTIMLGRGILANPGLLDLIEDQKKMDKQIIKAFHDEIYQGYKHILYGDRPVLFKMKEIWFYLIQGFSNHEKYFKKLKKVEKLMDYDAIVANLFRDEDILDSFGHAR